MMHKMAADTDANIISELLWLLPNPSSTISHHSKYGAIRWVWLAGDASAKKFYRVWVGDARSYILMLGNELKDSDLVQRIGVFYEQLRQAQVPTPRVLLSDGAQQWCIFEDCGDHTLLDFFCHEGLSSEDKKKFYFKALEHLARLHVSSYKEDQTSSGACFNKEKLLSEVAFTQEHLQILYQHAFTEAQHKIVMNGFDMIVKELEALPWVLCHRDYHAKNLMWHKDVLWVIDYQDMHWGVPYYDVASLLYDSYVRLEPSLQSACWEYYQQQLYLSGLYDVYTHHEKIYALSAMQRIYKAIGSYASIYNRKKNPLYLKYIGTAMENLRDVMQPYPEYQDVLKTVLTFLHRV